MYRVAVVQNESEMLRSGYTNVLPKLRSIKRLSHYSFELFNVVNIQKLFQEGDSYLLNFDSLFITTNATSDIRVLTRLRENKDVMEKFISSGRGLFIASQKKLSTAKFDSKTDEGKTGFLPEAYEFFTVERPKSEKDSGEGKISTYNNEDHILLQYPKRVTAELTMQHCEKNEFKKHCYRSHIVPYIDGSYVPIFVDRSYKEVPSRSLLMVNLVPQNGERVVISTIALDWEFHEDLLTNLIAYTTEGLPRVAFIDNAGIKHGDFDFLLTSAKLSKISHHIYDNVAQIKPELLNIHNTYIFSPDWKEQDVTDFLRNTFHSDNHNTNGRKSYVRVYYFKEFNNVLTLAQYSNFSTIDLIIDSSVLWVTSMFPNAMWGRSFWITYDILTMMYDIGENIETYISPILNDIRKHYTEYSYDGIMGATCGLFELMILLRSRYNKELIKERFSPNDFNGILGWIFDKYDSQSAYDKQTAMLTLHKYYSEIFLSKKYKVEKDKYSEMLESVCSTTHVDNAMPDKDSEIDLCRTISVCLLCENREAEIVDLLRKLKTIQTPSGRWTNTGRTAHVLVFLLKNLLRLKSLASAEINIDDMIYNGILHLRSEYNWKNANWDNDIQATAKAIHAIGMYNRLYKYSTQDFFKTLEVESDKIYSATVIHNVSESMRMLRQRTNEMLLKIESLTEANLKRQQELQEHKEKIEACELYESENVKQVKIARTVATICATLLLTMIFYLGVKHPQGAMKAIEQLDVWGIILGFVVALLLTNLAQNTILKSELVNRAKLKGRKG